MPNTLSPNELDEQARREMKLTIIPARRFVNDSGVMVYSKVRAGTMDDLAAEEADCFLCHGFAIVVAQP